MKFYLPPSNPQVSMSNTMTFFRLMCNTLFTGSTSDHLPIICFCWIKVFISPSYKWQENKSWLLFLLPHKTFFSCSLMMVRYNSCRLCHLAFWFLRETKKKQRNSTQRANSKWKIISPRSSSSSSSIRCNDDNADLVYDIFLISTVVYSLNGTAAAKQKKPKVFFFLWRTFGQIIFDSIS